MADDQASKRQKTSSGEHQLPLKICLIGTGRIGAVHLKNVIANTRMHLAYICDVDQKALDRFKDQVPGYTKLTTQFDEVLADKSVAGIVCCTPTAQHPDIIVKSLRAGKAVLCEKPISLKIDEIDACYNESKKLGVPLLCGYQRRSDPSFVKLWETCRNGGIGQVQIVKTVSRDNPVPTVAYLKISGGIFHDCGSHDIDVVRWIVGQDPHEVFAAASVFRPEIKQLNDFDTIMITLKFPNGVLGSIDLSRKAIYGYDQRIEVLGDKGHVQAQNKAPTSVIISTEHAIAGDPNMYSFPQRYTEAYANEMDHFADVILRKAEPRLSHEDARKVAIIADAAEESARHGKPVQIKY